MSKYNVEKVKEYLEQFEDDYEYYREFYIALLITDRLDLEVEDITEEIVEKIGDIYNRCETIYNESLNDDLRELEEELNTILYRDLTSEQKKIVYENYVEYCKSLSEEELKNIDWGYIPTYEEYNDLMMYKTHLFDKDTLEIV